MKSITVFILTIAAAVLFAACGAATENKPANNANANANTAKPTAAAPTREALFDMDKKANEAYIKGDAKYFEGFLSDKFVGYEMGNRMDKAQMLEMIAKTKCDIKSWSLDDPQMAMINADTAVISYKGTWDGTCVGSDGKSMKLPSPMRAASVYIRSGDKWLGAFHGENMIIDPKNPPPTPPKADAKKDEPKKDSAKKDDKAAPDAGVEPAKPAGSPNTDALVKLHTAGWEAWKAKDAKKFEEITAASLSNVDPIGTWIGSKAEIIKHWTEMKCEGVTTVKVTDGFATAFSPTVELLTSKGRADGTCDGQKNTDLYHSAIYVKEGDAWKLAFLFESLGM